MVGPEAIVRQVWQQVVPTDWKIIRGRRRSAFAPGWRAAAWTCAALIALAIALAMQGRFPGSARLAGYPALVVVAAGVVVLALLVGITVTIVVAIRRAGDPDPLIVLLPQGFVEYSSRHQPIIGVLYAELASADFRTPGSRQSWQNQPGQRQSRTRRKLVLHLFYKDGRKQRWRPRSDFGPPERLFEAISKARALYDVLYGDGR